MYGMMVWGMHLVQHIYTQYARRYYTLRYVWNIYVYIYIYILRYTRCCIYALTLMLYCNIRQYNINVLIIVYTHCIKQVIILLCTYMYMYYSIQELYIYQTSTSCDIRSVIYYNRCTFTTWNIINNLRFYRSTNNSKSKYKKRCLKHNT
jgi:hypothetical protein